MLRTGQLERFRPYLRLLARLQLGRRWQGKLDASDVVQQTLLQAFQGLPRLRASTDSAVATWLRRILANNLANAMRDLTRAKRNATREQSLNAALDASSLRLEAYLAADQSSPSQRAERNEELLRLAAALELLPNAQREALILHHLQDRSLSEIAQQLDRSTAAVAGLIKRGLKQLRLAMHSEDETRGE